MRDGLKLYKHHKSYSIYHSEHQWLNCYSDGAIESLQMILGTYNYVPDFLEWTLCALVAICFLAVALKSIIAKKK